MTTPSSSVDSIAKAMEGVTRFANSHNPNGLGFSNGITEDENGGYVRYDAYQDLARQAEALQRENAELRAVMKECHAALKMMISPGDISGSTVLGAFAAAKSAEARVRALLAATRSGSATSPKGVSE